MPTIRQALDKVSELRSRRALLQLVQQYLKNNYVDDDNGEAEMTVTRDDHALVSQAHIRDFLDLLSDQDVLAGSEMEEWENMQLLPPDAPSEDAVRAAVKGKKAARGG